MKVHLAIVLEDDARLLEQVRLDDRADDRDVGRLAQLLRDVARAAFERREALEDDLGELCKA